MQERRLLDADRVELESYLNGEDADMNELAEGELPDIREKLESLESQLQVALIPKDLADSRNAFVEIRAGTGGDEAALFVGDLTRMYLKFAETQGWKIEVLSESKADLGGYKEVIMKVAGDRVYGRLKFESGAHLSLIHI